MSKASGSTKFRRVDVDELDEENFRDETDGVESSDDASLLSQRESEVEGHIRTEPTKNNVEALKAALHSPVTASKDQKLKDQAFQIVMRVLTLYKSSEMEKAVASLDNEQIDVLMKYIYRGFSEPSEKSSAVLLQWHEKVLAKGGIGSIVRVLTDRKTV
ncbi:actin-related protein 2/3 complex subunit 5-C-like [Oscarella lobularis]|uniref:actin-related protein 2/3 complex subunit 5-C-like n=1 Tax=Oscarella lobularis TaxID=121494 RepID=UPI0033140B4F